MDDKSLLELCVKITGTFENGVPTYWALAGNFDGQGMSAGVLQWNAGQGTLQHLLTLIAAKMTWEKMQTFFKSDIHHFSMLKSQDAIQWCADHYLKEGSTHIDPVAIECWQNLLKQPESIEAQVEYASSTVLSRAKVLASNYFSDLPTSTRVASFFFDLVTQSGGMENSRGKVSPLVTGTIPDISKALEYAQGHDLKTAGMWEIVTQNDPLATRLVYYAYHRSLLSNPKYVWDAFSRRGTIACRSGVVHGAVMNFTSLLD